MNTFIQNKKRISLATLSLLALPFISQAQENAAAKETYFSNALFNTLLVSIILLAIIIVALSTVLKTISNSEALMHIIKKNNPSKGGPSAGIVTLFFLLMGSMSAIAQEKAAAAVVAKDGVGGIDTFTFYFMVTLLALELLVVVILILTIKYLLKSDVDIAASTASAKSKPKEKTIIDLLSDAVAVENEESIMLDHDYDGIRELDNNLPPWWKYGFYLTIIVAVLYMFNYHILKTSPLQAEEYTASMKKAEAEIAEYMKSSANNVDENTVKLLTESSDIAAGKEIFLGMCSACHGKLGEGGVGPNLTDDYWLHSGGVKDIFKTIKYGYPDKGMKSWKDDYSPIQIAQLASFIKTLRGTNPPKAKDKQGDLYTEGGAAAASDSSAVKTDSLKVVAPADTTKK